MYIHAKEINLIMRIQVEYAKYIFPCLIVMSTATTPSRVIPACHYYYRKTDKIESQLCLLEQKT